jgi:hypothetical protein
MTIKHAVQLPIFPFAAIFEAVHTLPVTLCEPNIADHPPQNYSKIEKLCG